MLRECRLNSDLRTSRRQNGHRYFGLLLTYDGGAPKARSKLTNLGRILLEGADCSQRVTAMLATFLRSQALGQILYIHKHPSL